MIICVNFEFKLVFLHGTAVVECMRTHSCTKYNKPFMFSL